jgi:hypothetical protein
MAVCPTACLIASLACVTYIGRMQQGLGGGEVARHVLVSCTLRSRGKNKMTLKTREVNNLALFSPTLISFLADQQGQFL